jgi:hypothetical protein
MKSQDLQVSLKMSQKVKTIILEEKRITLVVQNNILEQLVLAHYPQMFKQQ